MEAQMSRGMSAATEDDQVLPSLTIFEKQVNYAGKI